MLMILVFSGFAASFDPANAQSTTSEDQVSFSLLGQRDISLQGPLDSRSFSFRIPADWKLSNDGQLHLDYSAFFDSSSMAGDAGSNPAAGYLLVTINGIAIGTVTINQQGENSVDIPIPTSVWEQIDPTASSIVELGVRTPGPCNDAYQTSANGTGSLSVVVHPTSYFLLPHQANPLVPDLRQLPYPIFQDSFIPDSAILVLPDQPSEKGLQAGLVAAAAFGKLTEGALSLGTTTAGKLDPARLKDSHLIFVGIPSEFPQLDQVTWPTPLGKEGFTSDQIGAGDGVVQMALAPENSSHVWLMVSGNTDEGVLKAAQALETGGNIRVGTNPALSVVTETDRNDVTVGGPDEIHATFEELGYRNQDSQGPGIRYTEYIFNVPPGKTVGSGAYLNLIYTHSAMLDYDGAGLSVSLNGDYVGSLRFSSQDTEVSNWRLNLPTSSFIPGENHILISANLVPVSSCITTNQLWFTSRSDSELRLPLQTAVAEAPKLLLRKYPEPFFPDFDQTAFVVSKEDPASWSVASRIAFDMGGKITGSVSNAAVAFAEAVPETLRTARNLMIIGRPSQMPILQELATSMPAPFEPGSDIAQEPLQDAAFQVPSDIPVGYLQVFSSPWDANKVIWALTGNGEEGLNLAANTLDLPEQFSQLAGNFAVAYQDQIIPAQLGDDSVTVLGTPAVDAIQSAENVVNTEVQPTTSSSSSNLNVIVLIVVSVFVVLVIAYFGWRLLSKREK